MLTAKYAPVNQAWVVMFGDSLTSLDGHTVWNSLTELIAAARSCGLRATYMSPKLIVFDVAHAGRECYNENMFE